MTGPSKARHSDFLYKIHKEVSIESLKKKKERQTAQPRAPEQEIKASKPLAVKSVGIAAGEETPSLTGVHWRDPWDSRMYTNPPTGDLAPEGLNLLVGSRGSD